MSAPIALAPHTLALFACAALTAGCFFAPNLEPHGYVACASDDDCEPGRTCGDDDDGAGVCAPPPWRDENFGDRRVLVVTNEDEAPIAKGTAVPVLVGGEGERAGLLALTDVGADFRFADFDTVSGTWSDRSVFLDREDDRFTAWIPLAREVLQGRSDVLAWIESDSFDGQASVAEDPQATFLKFEGFDDDVLDESWLVRGTGGTPTIDRGLVNIGDNESLVLDRPLTPPMTVTALARVNGVNCTEVFIGFSGDEDAAFALPPAAGLFIDVVGNGLTGVARIGPVPDGQLEDRGALELSSAFMRVTVSVDGAGVRVLVDDTAVLDEPDVRPPFPTDPLYFAVHVGGACSLDVDALWITPLPLPSPSVTAGPLVELAL